MMRKKHQIHAIRPLPPVISLAELRRRYKEAHEHPRTLDELLTLPNPFIDDSEDQGNNNQRLSD